MEAKIIEHQLYQIIELIKKTYQTYGVQEKNGKISFALIKKGSGVRLDLKKPILSFKQILLPNGLDVNDFKDRKIAFIGLKNCDVWAFYAFLKEFSGTSLLPKLENIFVLSSDCLPDKNCFCGLIGTNKIAPFDLYVQENRGHFEIFSGSEKGNSILKKAAIPQSKTKLKINEIATEKTWPMESVSKLIENRAGNEKFWNAIANTCFGCGACTAACPLCFCTRQEFKNDLDGKTSQCLKWDACFAKRFSEIQNHFDYRPTNADRLYNWYHHKFVRAKYEHNHYLCTGCGRCIEACPANLNMKNIIETLLKLNKQITYEQKN